MLFHVLNAQCVKPPGFIVPPAVFVAMAPPPGGLFTSMPIGMLPLAVPSAMVGGEYVEVQVPAASILWDAITVGYGRLGDVALLTGGNLVMTRRVRQFAASRARLLRAIYDWPGGATLGPVLVPEYTFVESSERRVISYLIGQTVAQRLAKCVWNVPRLFHRSLYGPLLPQLNPVLPALAAGQSPDYLCLQPGGPGFGIIEAKGTNTNFNPQVYVGHRAKLNGAFRQLETVPGAWQSAVSVACFDGGLPANIIGGQLWDPPNPNAFPIRVEGAAALTAEYFRRLAALLGCFANQQSRQRSKFCTWNASSVGLHISMEVEQWKLVQKLVGRSIRDIDFFHEISAMLLETNDVDGPKGRNGDGLRLKLIDFD